MEKRINKIYKIIIFLLFFGWGIRFTITNQIALLILNCSFLIIFIMLCLFEVLNERINRIEEQLKPEQK